MEEGVRFFTIATKRIRIRIVVSQKAGTAFAVPVHIETIDYDALHAYKPVPPVKVYVPFGQLACVPAIVVIAVAVTAGVTVTPGLCTKTAPV
jgi:hypothetical protein